MWVKWLERHKCPFKHFIVNISSNREHDSSPILHIFNSKTSALGRVHWRLNSASTILPIVYNKLWLAPNGVISSSVNYVSSLDSEYVDNHDTLWNILRIKLIQTSSDVSHASCDNLSSTIFLCSKPNLNFSFSLRSQSVNCLIRWIFAVEFQLFQHSKFRNRCVHIRRTRNVLGKLIFNILENMFKSIRFGWKWVRNSCTKTLGISHFGVHVAVACWLEIIIWNFIYIHDTVRCRTTTWYVRINFFLVRSFRAVEQ